MIKKITFFICSVLLMLSTYCLASPIDKVEKFKGNFDRNREEFFSRAKQINYGQYLIIYCEESIKNTTYYVTIEVIPSGIIRLSVSKQTELENNICDITVEGITLKDGDYVYFIERWKLHRNEQGRQEYIDPIEIWDDIFRIIFSK